VNKAALPIFARLHALQTIARVAPGGSRVIATMADTSPLAALLCEVNETVLGRTLAFESSGGASLTLEVSGRRVLRLVASNGLPDAESCLAAEALEDEHKDDLIKLMQAVATPRHELRVFATPMTRDVDGVSVGLPVALLADLLLINLNPLEGETHAEQAPPELAARPAPRAVSAAPVEDSPVAAQPRLSARLGAAAAAKPEPVVEAEPEDVPEPAAASEVSDAPFLISLARGIGPDLMAWLVVGGESDGETDGPEEMVSHLQGFLADEGEALAAQFDQLSTEAGGDVCIVLGASLVESHSILCARRGPGVLLGVIDGDATQTVLRAWGTASAGQG
jgi:hypothetical protein